MEGSKFSDFVVMMCCASFIISAGSFMSGCFATHLMSKAQRHTAQAVSHRLNQEWPLARRQYHAGETDHVRTAHGVADHGERFLPDGLTWNNVIRLFEIAPINLPGRQKALDLDRARVLWPQDG